MRGKEATIAQSVQFNSQTREFIVIRIIIVSQDNGI